MHPLARRGGLTLTSVANIENCFISSNLVIASASGWLERLADRRVYFFFAYLSHGLNSHGCISYTKIPDFTAGSSVTIALASDSSATANTTAPPALSVSGPASFMEPFTYRLNIYLPCSFKGCSETGFPTSHAGPGRQMTRNVVVAAACCCSSAATRTCDE